MKTLRYALLLMLTLPAVGQTPDPLPPAYVSIASEGTYQGTSPIVTLPVGTVFAFGLLPANGGVLCDPITVTNTPANVVVWVASFQSTCLVNGKPPASGNGDPDPNQVKSLYVLQTAADQTGTYTIPPSTTVLNWKVTGYGAAPPVTPPVTPPASYTIFLCVSTAPVTITLDGSAQGPLPLVMAIEEAGAHTTLGVPGYSCQVIAQ